MTGMTNALEAALLEHIVGGVTYTPPDTWYLGVSTTTPDDDGANFTEPTDAAYVRTALNPAVWSAAVIGDPTIKAVNTSVFVAAGSTDWGLVTHVGYFETSTGGVPKVTGPLETPVAMTAGRALAFAPGQLSVQFSE